MNCLAVSEHHAALGTQDGRLQVLHLSTNERLCYLSSRQPVLYVDLVERQAEMYVCCGLDILTYSLGGARRELGVANADLPGQSTCGGQLVARLQRHRSPVIHMKVISALILMSYDRDGTVILWIVDEPTSFVVACSLDLGRGGGAAATGLRGGARLCIHSRLEYCVLAGCNCYSSLWKPNNAMAAMLIGKDKKVVSNRARKAQAIALSFSEAKIRTRTYQICTIL